MYHLADKYEFASGTKTFPRRWHTVRYYRDNMPICEDGRGMITEIEDGRIKFTFYWGNIENFQQLFNKNLNELKFRDTVNWSANSPFATDENANYGFFRMNFGANTIDRQAQHPSVSTNFLIKQIAQDNGIVINNIRDNKPITTNFIIPCLTKFSADWANSNYKYTCSNNIVDLGCIVPNGTDYVDANKLWDRNNQYFNLSAYDRAFVTVSEFRVRYNVTGQGVNPYLSIGERFKIEPTVMTGDNQIVIATFPAVEVNVDLSLGRYVRIQLTDDTHNGVQNLVGGVSAVEVTLTVYAKECQFDGGTPIRFPLAPNLPKMTQADFLRAIMQMNGLFAYARNPKTIDLFSIDDIYANIPKAVDWTDKLVNVSSNYAAPEKIEFSLSGFAQKNIFRYNNDDEITDDGSYFLSVNNVTIDKEKEAVELPFSQTKHCYEPLDDGFYCAYVPIYENYVLTNEFSPRILRPQKFGTIVLATTTNMNWPTLCRTNYAGYQNIIKNPRILQVRCMLNDSDFASIDFTIPVRFSQFGNYYAIQKIQSSANGICKCDFLELKNINLQGPPGAVGIPGAMGVPGGNVF